MQTSESFMRRASYYLDLSAVPSSDVADGPSSLLHYVHLGVLQQLGKYRNCLEYKKLALGAYNAI